MLRQIELALVCAWLAGLTFVAILLVRQFGLITARLAQGGSAVQSAGSLPIGAPVPRSFLSTPFAHVRLVVFAGADCEACRDVMTTMTRDRVPPGVLVALTGQGGVADALAEGARASASVARDPDATGIHSSFEVTSTPLALKLEGGIIVGRALLRTVDDLRALDAPANFVPRDSMTLEAIMSTEVEA